MAYEDKTFFRRKFPRRVFKRGLGVLHRGQFHICESEEIGEGGLSFTCAEALLVDSLIVVSFRIPGGDFVSLRAQVKSARPHESGRFVHGISFANIAFSRKRQIRSFVSERTERESA